MKTLTLAAAAASIAAIAAPANAQVNAIGVANIEAAVRQSTAWTTAAQQLRTTYATQIQQATARETALRTELQPLVTAFQTAQAQPNANEATLRTQYENIQRRQQAAQQEIRGISEPVARAQAYVEEQIAQRLDTAVRQAMQKRNVSLVLQPQATVSYAPTVDITSAIVAELNTLVPSVGITPPAGWQPGQAGQAAQQGAAPAAPAAPARQPSGR